MKRFFVKQNCNIILLRCNITFRKIRSILKKKNIVKVYILNYVMIYFQNKYKNAISRMHVQSQMKY